MYIYKWHEFDQTKHEIFCVHIVCNEMQVKVNLEITTFFFYLRFPYCPNFFWFGVVYIYIYIYIYTVYIYICIYIYIYSIYLFSIGLLFHYNELYIKAIEINLFEKSLEWNMMYNSPVCIGKWECLSSADSDLDIKQSREYGGRYHAKINKINKWYQMRHTHTCKK